MPGLHRYQLITFDVYTALFDVEGSLTPLVSQTLGGRAEGLGIVRTWRAKQLEYALISNSLQQGRVAFAVITRRALDYALRQAQLDLPELERQRLVAAWDELRLWPEAADVLTAVKARGYAVGFLSNGDEAMLRALAARLPIVCDHVFASERAGQYKPHPQVYALPLQDSGLEPDNVLHVAGSATDVMGTKAAGLPCAWSNRRHDNVLDPQYRPDYAFEDLRGLLDVV